MQRFESRRAMLELVHKGGRVAEIGVFAGDFSAEILEVCRPRELLLIDLWSGEVSSGDVDGDNVRVISGEKLEAGVRARFGGRSEVRVMKGTSRQLEEIGANQLDAIYVDADHQYEGVRRDLLASWRCVKDGGFLMGHDYEINQGKSTGAWKFGVQAAVDDFCRDFGQRIVALTDDGCASFAIKIQKRDAPVEIMARWRSGLSLWRHRWGRLAGRLGRMRR